MTSAETTLEQGRERVNAALERWLPPAGRGHAALNDAMRYAVLGSGKRLRPALVYATGRALGAADEALDPAACAVELIHAYSLVHDDLPSMDDDDLRRGAPSCHREFGEATAILAGDALQSLAFELLTSDATAGPVPPETRCRMAARLALAAGAAGMAGGQAIDLSLERTTAEVTEDRLEQLHRCKTGALIQASIALGALAAGGSAELVARLEEYGGRVGLAFQIVDDILDVTTDTATLGKLQGADQERGKPTYPSLLGLDRARALAETQHRAALDALDGLGASYEPLRALAGFVVQRSW